MQSLLLATPFYRSITSEIETVEVNVNKSITYTCEEPFNMKKKKLYRAQTLSIWRKRIRISLQMADTWTFVTEP